MPRPGPTSDDYLRAAQQLYPELNDHRISPDGAEVVAKNALGQVVTTRTDIINAMMTGQAARPAPKAGE
jgi:hypothetical protein